MGSRAATVATVVMPNERSRLETLGHGCFVALHRESIEDAALAVRRHAAEAVFLSVHRFQDADLPRIARFVREFPNIPTVALISRADEAAAERVLRLGASGVRAVVDLSASGGYQRLRDLLREPVSPAVATIMAALDAELAPAPPDCRIFFELVVRRSTESVTVAKLARELRLVPSTLMARFLRAGLPSPKTYMAHTRLLHAAWLLKSEGYSISDVAYRLEYSSPQGLGRHLRVVLGMTAGEFRRRLPFGAALVRYRATLVTPYRDRLLAFHPLGTMPGNHGHRGVSAGRSG
jgi:AraC-like DNA-binding protein